MSDVVNLNRFRKRAKREAEAKRAAANRAAHGRPKAARSLEKARAEKLRRLVDAHKIDPGDVR